MRVLSTVSGRCQPRKRVPAPPNVDGSWITMCQGLVPRQIWWCCRCRKRGHREPLIGLGVPKENPSPLYESHPPQEISGLEAWTSFLHGPAKETTAMRIGLTIEEYIELRLGPPSGADPAFQAESEKLFPMNRASASNHLRSRGYDCRPPMLELLIQNSVVNPADSGAWVRQLVGSLKMKCGFKVFIKIQNYNIHRAIHLNISFSFSCFNGN